MSLVPEQASLYVESQGQQIHLRHIRASHVNKDAIATPIFMVHGAIENGRIFYTESGKGLACFLAKQGFDVYVMDMRGRGKSKPTMSASSDYGQFETINQDIPACIDFIFERSRQPMHLICHSWGGYYWPVY